MNIDINKQIQSLTKNVNGFLSPYLVIEKNKLNPFSYKKENYVITFPFNFTAGLKKEGEELIQKLAMVNAVYVKYFFREDNVLDEYHVPTNQYRDFLALMCEGHIFRNLAVEQFVKMVGEEIIRYINKYEKLYYEALINEKLKTDVSFENVYDEFYKKTLCYKVMPLCVVFAAFCIITDQHYKIIDCEEMVVNFQIASQIIDDLKDLKKDILCPDKSVLIKAYMNKFPDIEKDPSVIKQYLLEKEYYQMLIDKVKEHLSNAKIISEKLKFNLFVEDISNYQRIVENIKH